MNPQTEAINFRTDGDIAERLRALAKQNDRGVSDELRAGIEIYLLLLEMTNVRANVELDRTRAEELERAIKDEFGRIFMAAMSLDAENAFENDLEVQYPRDTFRAIAVPFDRLLDWVAGIPAADRPSAAELVAEAHKWSDSSLVIESGSLPPRGKLRSWARALELAGDETATLSRVQQALRALPS
jgi:hypothetical protein